MPNKDGSETVGDRLVRALKDKRPDISLAAIAREINISSETLRKWVAGETAPSRRRAAQLSDQYKIPLPWLMHGPEVVAGGRPIAVVERPSVDAQRRIADALEALSDELDGLDEVSESMVTAALHRFVDSRKELLKKTADALTRVTQPSKPFKVRDGAQLPELSEPRKGTGT